MPFLRGIFKIMRTVWYTRPMTEYAEITELYIVWSELSWRKLSPTSPSATTLALTTLLG